MREYRRFWVALTVLALLSPIGVYLPGIMQAGPAWGEWGLDEIRQMLGYAPAGMERHAGVWQAPLRDYALSLRGEPTASRRGLAYLLSAFVGTAACGGGGYLLARWVTGRRGRGRA